MTPTSAPLPSDAPYALPLFFASAGRDTGTGIAFTDRDGRFLFVSDGMAAINGLAASEHIGRRFGDLWPEAWESMSEHFTRVLEGRAVAFTVVLPTAPDGRRGGDFQVYWSPVRDEAGEVIGVAATVVDATEVGQRQAREHEAAARQSTLRAIANRALSDAPMQEVFRDAVAALQRHLDLPFVRTMRVVAGSDRLEVYADRGWDTEIVRRTPAGPRRGSFAEYVLGSNSTVQFNDLLHEHRFRQPAVFLAHGIRSGIGVRLSTGDRPWGVLGGYDVRERTFDCDEIGFIEELAAIVGLMVHERESRAFREEVLSMASHQMRTPLTSVIGLAQHIQRRIKQGRVDTTPDLIESLVAEAFRLDEVLTQWNELAAAESYREVFAADPVDVTAVLGERVEQFRSRHRDIQVSEDYPEPCDPISSDARRIGEIVDNLLENAAKYGGSRVEVSVECRAGGVAVHCRDYGPGVPSDIAPFIFDRFFRGSSGSGHSGMGLGLYISRKLAEGLGGTLDILSTPGEGAHFTLFLPNERRKRGDAALDVAVPSQPAG